MVVNGHVFWRVLWSIFWRVTLIGMLITSGLSAVQSQFPVGEIEQQVMTRVEADIQKRFDAADTEEDPIKRLERTVKISEDISFVEAYEMGLRYAQEAIRERGLLSWVYIRDMLITLLPTLIATVITVGIVLDKRWKRFQLSVLDASGTARKPFWKPALAFSCVQYAPLFFISGAFYYIPWFTSSWWAFVVWNLIGSVIYAAGVYLALRWPYRSFRLHMTPVTESVQAA